MDNILFLKEEKPQAEKYIFNGKNIINDFGSVFASSTGFGAWGRYTESLSTEDYLDKPDNKSILFLESK